MNSQPAHLPAVKTAVYVGPWSDRRSHRLLIVLRTWRFFRKLEATVFDMYLGLHNGYPACCVFDYLRDQWSETPFRAESRIGVFGIRRLRNMPYVPCSMHLQEWLHGELLPQARECDCHKNQDEPICRFLMTWIASMAHARDRRWAQVGRHSGKIYE